jgi:hypothetical protein
MDTVLVAVAALSLAMATGMAVVVAKMLRDERARSQARVLALSEMAAVSPASAGGAPAPPAEPAAAVDLMRPAPAPPKRALDHPREGGRAASPAPARVPVPVPVQPAAPTPAAATLIRAARLDDLEIRPAQPAAAQAADLFAERHQQSPWGPRFAVIGMMVAGLAIIGFAMTAAAARRSAAVPASSATARVAAANLPLELLSLRHEQQPQTLTITGLVRNPRGGAPLSRIVATAFVFAADGTFLASSRASLDFTTLAAGDESPFVIAVPVTGDVARYRIGFRTEDGSVVAHVDRRAPEALASTSPK